LPVYCGHFACKLRTFCPVIGHFVRYGGNISSITVIIFRKAALICGRVASVIKSQRLDRPITAFVKFRLICPRMMFTVATASLAIRPS
jgi:hypothetical protein